MLTSQDRTAPPSFFLADISTMGEAYWWYSTDGDFLRDVVRYARENGVPAYLIPSLRSAIADSCPEVD